ncbi:MAG: PPC domain-containing protein [Thermoguttaceae bacterium]
MSLRHSILRSLLFFALFPACVAFAQDRRPNIAYVYPAGGRQGTTFEVTVGGRFLTYFVPPVTRVYVSGAGVKAEVVGEIKPLPGPELESLRKKAYQLMKNKPDARARREIAEIKRTISRNMSPGVLMTTSPAIAEAVAVRITLAADAEPGQREIRVESSAGISNPFRFYVGQLPEFYEREPEMVVQSSDFMAPSYPEAVPTNITLPAVVNGQIIPHDPDVFYLEPGGFTPGVADRYCFEARKGQELVVAASARELNPYLADAVPGWFQATLALYDAKGKELAYDDDYRFHPDPVLLFKVPEDGQYTIEIKDAIYRGRRDFVYRITAGELPFITSIFPLGGRAGAPATVRLSGCNLPAETLTIAPKSAGTHPISVRKGDLISNTVPFAVDTLPECLEQEPNDTLQSAQPVTLPVIVNGRIDRPGDWDVFRFEGRAGQQIIAEACARRLESPLDSVLELFDAAGQRLAFNDDYEDKGDGLHTHYADSLIHFTVPADGTYYVRLGDAQRHGGPEYAYRLRLSAPRPDFELRVAPSCINAISWRLNPITVAVLRKDGFSGPITLAFKDAPGLALNGAVVPEGQDRVRMTLAVASMLSAEPVSLCLQGRAMIGGKEVVRQAVPADERMQAFFYKHMVPARDLTLVLPEDRARFRPPAAGGKQETSHASRPAFQNPWVVISEQPVRIPVGGVAEVLVRMPGVARGEHSVQLSDPPDGITADRAAGTERGLTVVLRGDAEKARLGLKGNLIAKVITKSTVTDKDGKTRVERWETPLPAISFEIVKP